MTEPNRLSTENDIYLQGELGGCGQKQNVACKVPEKPPDPAVAEIRQDTQTAPLRLDQHLTYITFGRRGKEALTSESSKTSRTVQLGKKH